MHEREDPDSCAFCKIVRKQEPAHVVWEDERTLTFMDTSPMADGHTLVIPKAHCSNLLDAEEADLRAVIARSHPVARAIRDVLSPDGIAVFQMNGAAAGQTVFHYHMHLIPRSSGEVLKLHSRVPGDPARLSDLAVRLGEAISARDAEA